MKCVDETKAILKAVRNKIDYEVPDCDERVRIVEEIQEEYGTLLNNRLQECIDGNIKDYNNMYYQISNMMDTIANYILFAKTDIEVEMNDENKEMYPYSKQELKTFVAEKGTISLEDYAVQINNDEEGGVRKHYDDQNSGSVALKDFEHRMHECPYVSDYRDFSQSAKALIEEFNDKEKELESDIELLDGYGYKEEARLLEEKNTYTESLFMGVEDGTKVYKSYTGLGFTLSNGYFYTSDRIRILCRGVGYRPNNLMELDQDVAYLLHSHFGLFYFTSPLVETTQPDWGLVDYGDSDTVMELLRYRGGNLNTWRGIFTHDIDELMKSVEFTDTESELLDLYQSTDMTQEDMGAEVGMTQQGALSALKTACRKISKVHEKNYEDWIYFGIGVVRGEFKTCSRCGDVKLTKYFGKDKRIKDGYRSSCRECENKNR